MDKGLVIRRAWRSQWNRFIVYFFLCAATVALSVYIPSSVIQGRLFTWGDVDIIISIPLFSFLALYGFFNLIYPVYDATLTLDNRGIETRVGIISLNQDITRVRYEDIRSIEKMQTLMERILNVGTLAIGSAGTSGIEILFDGVAQPMEVKNLIQQEQDRRMKKNDGGLGEKIALGQD